MLRRSKVAALVWVGWAVVIGWLLLYMANEYNRIQDEMRISNELLAIDRELAHVRMCYMYRTVWHAWEPVPTLAPYSFPSPDLEKWCAK